MYVVVNNKILKLFWQGRKHQVNKESISDCQILELPDLGHQVTHSVYVLSDISTTSVLL